MSTKTTPRVNTLLRKERLLREWSQQHLADRLGITIVTVNRWERGIQQPSPIFRLKLCALFGKNEEELGLYREEEVEGNPATPGMLNLKKELMNVPHTKTLQQESHRLDAQLLDHPSLQEYSNTASAQTPVLANTSLRNIPVFQTTSPLEELAREAHVSLAQEQDVFLKQRFLFMRPTFLLPVLFVLIIIGATIFIYRPYTPFSHPVTSPPLTSHPTASSRPLSSGQLLYEARWSKDFGGWKASSHWHWSDQDGGMITSDSMTNSIITAPYQLSISAYAIEASIQHLSYTNLEGNAYGIAVGMTPTNGDVCGIGIHEQPEHFFIGQLMLPITQNQPTIAADVFRSPVVLDTAWHTYRVEVTPNHIRFFFDGKIIGQVNNDTSLQEGQTGIYTVGTLIHIKKYRIFAL